MLVLASASPRRHELLVNAGIDHIVRPADIPEELLPGEDAAAMVLRLAREKALACRAALGPSEAALPVLGADTAVVVDGIMLAKPQDPADAARMLALLSGRSHQVITGVCLATLQSLETAMAATTVTFRSLSGDEIADYVATGEPMDKAGAYAVQGRASRWVTRLAGCYFNVVGLPVSLVSSMLEGL